jgi:hypothetical protein
MIRQLLILIAFGAMLQAQESITREVFQGHLTVWKFEVELNRRVPKKSLIEINPYTESVIRANAHRFVIETREALAKDITLLLAIKENETIAEFARKKGMKVYRNSFGKGEWTEWLALLGEMAREASGAKSDKGESGSLRQDK